VKTSRTNAMLPLLFAIIAAVAATRMDDPLRTVLYVIAILMLVIGGDMFLRPAGADRP